MEMQEKILNAILDTQSTVTDMNERLARVEDVQGNMYNRIDGFLTLINKHEAEIAGLRSKYERLEERIAKLELKNT
ncbi:hypothetical protein IT409_01695 [Candidatus Falkowbacteria bacterium]|nr:hypothetical protein [Candidatus Falkowbacteria bacterium]